MPPLSAGLTGADEGNLMAQYVSYAVWDDEHNVPVSTGTTREEAQKKAITRVLTSGAVSHGQTIHTQHRDDISADDFAKLKELTDQFFRERGID